ncbi:MAG: biotin--[acetyl-CoA-carboxylase] ligase, partial [Planctomycetota bacterium]|nr:biotin--[acetyl-CoA-carboxylase] ligase [Planctomycetota bacterium]
WLSTPGRSLLFSLLLDLEPPETFASVLTIATATALARSIQDIAGVPARIKFPNDILVRGKKVAGVLLEVKDYGVPARAVAGVGINVNQLEKDLPAEIADFATSLRAERRKHEPVRRSRLLRYFLRQLEKWLDRIAAGEFADLENAWNRFSAMEGREVSFRSGNEDVSGRITDASIREGLLIRLATGGERRCRLEHITDFKYQ